MTKLEEFEQRMAGCKTDVIGIGISNLPLVRYLARLGAEVTACDRRSKEALGAVAEELEQLGVQLNLGEGYLDALKGDIIFKTPGMRYDVPQLLEAAQRGAKVTSEMEAFFEICPAHILAVTGSDGKTTTTTLIHQMLTEAGYTTWLGGNIGNPLLTQANEMKPQDWVVLELSSFQLHTMKQSPEIAVITNITPNHLDMHKDYQEYIDAKKNIMLYQGKNNLLVVNADNAVTNGIGDEAAGTCRRFSRKRSDVEVFLQEGVIYRGGEAVLETSQIKIPGMHNVENYMTAIATIGDMVPVPVIQKVAMEFGGVAHRIELVRTLGGVRYYNSSIDSSPNRTINTLRVFPERVILIAGGKDKGIGYEEIGPAIAEHVKILILIGATAGKIEEALQDEIKKTGLGKEVQIFHADTYEEVVQTARRCAKAGDVVLLSPASTSFDMFKNFEERGNLFKTLVNEME